MTTDDIKRFRQLNEAYLPISPSGIDYMLDEIERLQTENEILKHNVKVLWEVENVK